jgi:hypothetical protein
MRKKDTIFWLATTIFVASAVIAGVTHNQLWCFLMVGSYLLRPTVTSLGFARRLTDERQLTIQYRSGNIAFAVMMIASIGLAVWLNVKEDKSWEMFNIVIMLGLATKAFFNILLVKNYREIGSRIIMAAGMLVLLFVAAENGLTLGGLIEAVPWILVIGMGWLSRRYPRAIATVIFVVTALLLFVILRMGITPPQFATALLVCVPLAAAGVCLILPERGEITMAGEPPAVTPT